LLSGSWGVYLRTTNNKIQLPSDAFEIRKVHEIWPDFL
jgi:hypothetical protein